MDSVQQVNSVRYAMVGLKLYNKMVHKLVHQIQQSPKDFDVVVSILNGGRKLGHDISSALQLPLRHVTISRYDGNDDKRTMPVIDAGSYNFSQWQNPLVVDDLVDDGITMRLFFNHFGPAKSAVLFYKLGTVPVADFFIDLKPNKWVVFPWEQQS